MAGDEILPYQQPGQWVQAGIVGMAFPKDVTEITFRGKSLYLIPGKDAERGNEFGGLYPVVALEHSGMSFEEGQRLISSFVNSITWVRKSGIETAVFGGGSRIHGLGGRGARSDVDERFALDYLPDPDDDKARLALAFYREGLNLNSVAFQCLSFFKILNLVLPNGRAQIDWIDTNIADARKLDPFRTRNWEREVGLDVKKETAGNYLYVSNRCAIAHANVEPLIDPYDPDDRRRLTNDLPMVRVLAEHMIEQQFGVKSAHTIWKEHLYELQGFTDLFGMELVNRIKAAEEVPLEQFPALPPLSVRLAFNERFASFEGMAVEVIDCSEGRVNLALTSATGLASVMLVLNFATERLDFTIFDHLATEDDGSVAGAQAELDRLVFEDLYVGNGKLEVWSGDHRLSRKDAYLPENIDLGATHENYQKLIATAKTVLEQRSG